MGNAGDYEEYAFIADLYDYVVPYRDRPDVTFFAIMKPPRLKREVRQATDWEKHE